MGDIIQLDSHRRPWREVFTVDGAASTLQAYKNLMTGEVEIVQMNDEGETIRTVLTPDDAVILREALVPAQRTTKGPAT